MAELTNLTQAFSEFADSVFATFPPKSAAEYAVMQ
jgi:hypothetical protein